MRIKIYYMLLIAVCALSGCQATKVEDPDLKPLFSQVITYPEAVVDNRQTTYVCEVSNFDINCGLTKTYIKVGDGYPMECTPQNGILGITETFDEDTKITFSASYWDYDSEEYKYVEQVYDVKLQEPYFHEFIFGDTPDYIYSNTDIFDYMHPEQIGDTLYYVSYDSKFGTKSDSFDYYYFTDGGLSAVGRSEHYEPSYVFSEFPFYPFGESYVYSGKGFNNDITDKITVNSINAVYKDGFTPSNDEATVVAQIIKNKTVSDDKSLQIITDLMLSGNVEFYVEVILDNYPTLWLTEHHAVYDYTPEGKMTSEYTLKKSTLDQ